LTVDAVRLKERAEELATIDALCRNARQGSGSALIVEGPAGIGKTELLNATRDTAHRHGLGVLSAVGGELERDHPFGIVRQLLERRVLGASDKERRSILRGAARLAAPVLTDVPSPPASPEAGHAVLHGLYWVVANMAARPLLLVVDDAQWADSASLSWVEYLIRRLEGMPILVALAQRSGEAGAAPDFLARLAANPLVREVRPRPLSHDATSELIKVALGIQPSAEFVAACHEASGGNPYLVRALAALVREQDIAPTPANAARVAGMSPASVEQQLVLRLGRLGPDATALAQAVAVLGTQVELRHAAILAEMDIKTAGTAVDALAEAHILRSTKPLDFLHPLIGTAVQGTLPPRSAMAAHRRAAALLAADGQPPDVIAAHLIATDPASDPWTVEQLRNAARIAFERGAHAGAITYLERALDEGSDVDHQAQLLLELGTVEALSAQPAAFEHLTAAHRLLGDPRLRARAVLPLSQVMFATDRLTQALPLLEDAITDLGDSDLDLQAKLLSQALHAARNGLRGDVIRRLMPRLERLAGTSGTASDAYLAHRSVQATFAAEPAQQAGELAVNALSSGRLRARLLEGDIDFLLAAGTLILAERYEEAERHLGDALREVQRSGMPAIAGAILFFLAEIAIRRGDPMPDADLWLARDVANENAQLVLAPAAAFMVLAMVDRGERDEAAQLLRENSLDGQLPELYPFSFVLLARGRLSLALGDAKRALADLTELGRRDDLMGGSNPTLWPWRSTAALAALDLGERARALALAHDEMSVARQVGASGAIGVALRAVGLVEGGDVGLRHLEEAADVLGSSHARLEYARVLTDLGAALRRSGQVRLAREKLRAAMDLAHRCTATAVEQRAHAELLAAGARPRRPVVIGPEALTPAERRVALMAAEGRSNREIAEGLFVTLRTVEIHLTHAYEKLRIRSRDGLAEALAAGSRSSPGRQAISAGGGIQG
jgi:DNA-binding CsgD family transcriptional regulator